MCAICVYIVMLEEIILCTCFMNENMVKPVQNKGIFICSFAKNIEHIRMCKNR